MQATPSKYVRTAHARSRQQYINDC